MAKATSKPAEEAPTTAPHSDVMNIHTKSIALESGIVEIGETALATAAEVSNLSPEYLRVV